ncbi:MAG: hypothetical protein AB1896_18220 [Thermodesulfobacteriota bacterium]
MSEKAEVKTPRSGAVRRPKKAEVVVPKEEVVADQILKGLRRTHRRGV